MERARMTEKNTRRVGLHLSIAGGVHQALRAALALRCQTVQIFVKNQRQWRAAPLDPEDVSAWHTLLATPGFGPAIAHATYLINLASPSRSLHARSVAAFTEELERCDLLDIPYLVVHPGAATGSEPSEAVRRVAEALNRIFDRKPDMGVRPALELTAGQGSCLGATFEELAEIIDQVEQPDRVAVCVDTCHAFAAGYDLRDAAGYTAMMALAERTVGVSRICCWHLNDSKGGCGSRLDRHTHIGHGEIGTGGFVQVLSDARFADVPLVLETPKGEDDQGREWDRVNLRRVRALATRARRRNAPA
jgi:deoxyribonuclease-4